MCVCVCRCRSICLCQLSVQFLVATVVIEESAYQMVSEMTVDRTNAIQKIVDGIYAHNRENTDIISSICTLFIELSHYG